VIERIERESLIPPELAGYRLDAALARLYSEFSRSQLQKWIRDGAVHLDGAVYRPRTVVAAGQRVSLNAVCKEAPALQPQSIPLDIVYEDEALLIVNKPAGLVVHPGAGNPDGTLQNALLHHAPKLVRVPRTGLVHRLDKDTSGLLAVARSLEAHTRLVKALEARAFERVYEAVTVGAMTAGGTVDAPIARHPIDRIRMAVREQGRSAVTHYRVIERFRAHTHVSVQLDTGRTHQIRVHLAHLRHPLVGDPLYGRRLFLPAGATNALIDCLKQFKRQALHARRLGLAHPLSGKPLRFEAPPPDDFTALLDALHADTHVEMPV
jgi:23S rRNA pseudouridine1911/1915/1917 synthase